MGKTGKGGDRRKGGGKDREKKKREKIEKEKNLNRTVNRTQLRSKSTSKKIKFWDLVFNVSKLEGWMNKPLLILPFLSFY